MAASPVVLNRLDMGNDSTGGAAAQQEQESSAAKTAEVPTTERKYTLPRQKEVKHFYESERVQQIIAGIIMLNFAFSILQREIDPFSEGDPRKTEEGNDAALPEDWQDYYVLWNVSNIAFNIIFIIELAINIYGRWWHEFWASGWNKFDFLVVAVSIFDMLPFIPLPGPAKLIKMLRAFRVFRLFNRIESMRKIIASIVKAIPGVANAFIIQLIFLCIYAVLSVEFFSFIGCEPDSINYGFGRTSRAGGPYLKEGYPGYACWGEEYYGTFFRALYTMFQVLTGESWSEAGARPAIAYYAGEDNLLYVFITYFFFYSFILVNQMTLLNVVVAVLMDGMSSESPPVEEDDVTHPENVLKRIEAKLNLLTDEVIALKRNADEARTNPAVQSDVVGVVQM